MGILDDAIREHLELKRRLGADDAELARLEDEAFGPPSRPGEPDVPGRQEGGQAVAAVTTEAPPAPAEGPEEEPSEPAATLFHDQEAEERAEAAPVEAPPPREPIPAEPPEPLSEAPPAAETSAPEPPRTEDEPASEAPITGEEPALEPPYTDEQPALGPSDTSERPIESLDTVEHPFEGAIEDTGEAEIVEGKLEEGRELEGEEEGEEEDVLEETPEFLRDAPEDDELWFEQGEPKDFDF